MSPKFSANKFHFRLFNQCVSHSIDAFIAHTIMHQDKDNALAIYLVHIHKDRTAEIYKSAYLKKIINENIMAVNFWHFTEDYVINNISSQSFYR